MINDDKSHVISLSPNTPRSRGVMKALVGRSTIHYQNYSLTDVALWPHEVHSK